MHNRLRRVVGEREAERARKLSPQISLVQALVGVFLELRRGPSSRRGTNTQVKLHLPRTVIPRTRIIQKPSVTERRVVSLDIHMEVSAW